MMHSALWACPVYRVQNQLPRQPRARVKVHPEHSCGESGESAVTVTSVCLCEGGVCGCEGVLGVPPHSVRSSTGCWTTEEPRSRSKDCVALDGCDDGYLHILSYLLSMANNYM